MEAIKPSSPAKEILLGRTDIEANGRGEEATFEEEGRGAFKASKFSCDKDIGGI